MAVGFRDPTDPSEGVAATLAVFGTGEVRELPDQLSPSINVGHGGYFSQQRDGATKKLDPLALEYEDYPETREGFYDLSGMAVPPWDGIRFGENILIKPFIGTLAICTPTGQAYRVSASYGESIQNLTVIDQENLVLRLTYNHPPRELEDLKGDTRLRRVRWIGDGTGGEIAPEPAGAAAGGED